MFGFDKATAMQLKRLAKTTPAPARTNRPRYDFRTIEGPGGVAVPAPLHNALTIFQVTTPDPIAGATFDSGSGTWTLGMGSAKVLQRQGNEPDTQDVTTATPDDALTAHENIDSGAEVFVRVFNANTTATVASKVYSVVQDMFGDLYIIIPTGGGGTTVISFIATENMAGASSCTADILAIVAGEEPNGFGASDEVIIHDTFAQFPRILAGSTGLAIWDEVAGYYEILNANQECFLGRAQIDQTGGIGASSAIEVVIHSFEPMSPPPFDLPPSPLPTEAINVYQHRAPDNYYVLLAWNETEETWDIIGVEMVDLPVVIDIKIADGFLQKQTVPAAVETNDIPESGDNWENVHATTVCEEP